METKTKAMKKIYLFFCLFSVAFVACSKKNDKPTPNNNSIAITITPHDTSVNYLDTVMYTIVASSINPLSTATFSQSINGGKDTVAESPKTLSGTTNRFNTTYIIPPGTV